MKMDGPTNDDIDAAIAKVNGLILAINADLTNAPKYKRAEPWWTSRCSERIRLIRQKQFLIARRGDIAQK